MALPHHQRPVSFQQVIDALLDETQPFPAKYLHRFSDITPEDLHLLKGIWNRVQTDRRAALVEDLETLLESDTLLSFDDFAKSILQDPDARVRGGAIRLLWENQDPRLVPTLIEMLNQDEDLMVRATAANALGQFVYLGELEEIPSSVLRETEDNLLAVATSREPAILRRRALESLGYSSRDEVEEIIRTAFESEDPEWLASSLFAMGRSADEIWEPEVLEMIDHPETDVQIEAVRAAGNLELNGARQILLDMLENGIPDDEMRTAVVWSLSQIGGENVQDALSELLESTEDDEEAEMIEQALENLTFTDGFDRFAMLDFAETGDGKAAGGRPNEAEAEEDEEDYEEDWDDPSIQ